MGPMVTFRGLLPSEAAVMQAAREWDKLSRMLGGQGRCQVVVEQPHRSHQHGVEFKVSVHIHDVAPPALSMAHPGCAHHGELGRALKQAFSNARRGLLPRKPQRAVVDFERLSA